MGSGELFEALRRHNEIATLAPLRLRIDVNRAGVTPPVEPCDHSAARVEEDAV